MKGATAVPLARTTREPNTASMRMSGRSQYFLRTRIKVHNSPMKSIMASSELAGHRVRRRARRMALDPIGDGVAVKPKPQRIPAEQAAHDAHGGHGRIEHQAQDDRAHAGVNEQPDPEPEPPQGRQHAGSGESGQEEGSRDQQSPAAHLPASNERPEAQDSENDCESNSEGPVRRANHYLVDDKPLMSLCRPLSHDTYLSAPVPCQSKGRGTTDGAIHAIQHSRVPDP